MIRVNLLKPEKKEIEEKPALFEPEAKVKKKTPKGNLVIFFAIILLAVLAFLQKKAITNERGLLNAALEEKKKLEPVLVKLDRVEQQKSFLEKKIGLINQLKAQQGGAVRIMEELSAELPEWVWLTEASLNRRMIQIKGKALSNILISDYVRNLEKSGLFDAFVLLGSTQKNQGGNLYLEFSLSANFVPLQESKPQEKTAEQPKKTEPR